MIDHQRRDRVERLTASAFGHIAFFTALCLQRFGVPLGSNTLLSFSQPVLWLLIGWMLLSGRARFYMPSTIAFAMFGAWALLASVCSVLFPSSDSGFSLFSLLGVLMTYAFLTLRPTDMFRGDIVQKVFLFYARMCAVLGILQFGLQFAHVRLFSFQKLMPFLRPILLERFFNVNAVTSYGSSTLRSNGFFLVEPSMFSQLLAMAIILDFFIMGRRRWLPLYLLAYMASYSGTGLLSLAITMAFMSLTSGKTFVRMAVMGAAAILTGAVAAVLLPTEFGKFVGRFGELSQKGTSGNARYVVGVQEIQYYLGNIRGLLGYGSGAATHSVHYVQGAGNTGVQLLIDYGLVGLALFFVFILLAVWRRGYAPLCLFLIVDFELGGGLLLFSPYTLIMCALMIWGCNRSAVQPHPATQAQALGGHGAIRPAYEPS